MTIQEERRADVPLEYAPGAVAVVVVVTAQHFNATLLPWGDDGDVRACAMEVNAYQFHMVGSTRHSDFLHRGVLVADAWRKVGDDGLVGCVRERAFGGTGGSLEGAIWYRPNGGTKGRVHMLRKTKERNEGERKEEAHYKYHSPV
eukprot:CAMPEP_0182494334 /NCGR_PEP_ID=MMETSP1321-20130603/3213_1 /TAXON_ID=91990 /ORGANISM="Bolidomonas sp., Strain RCC1657" /LENGTH=144 /DNA_ID=CAMNT_0024697385 /DNA_START=1230 /DNA_END=1665 /DNA_ORIENTATION=-